MNQPDSQPLTSQPLGSQTFTPQGHSAGGVPQPGRPGPGASAPAWRLAFIQAQWHAEIVSRAHVAFMAELARHRIPAEAVRSWQVPGAFELPLHARKLAETGRFDAIVACALVVDGGIYRHEFVAQAVINGLMRVQLDSGVPVISAVLTPKSFHEHDQHRRFFAEHFVVKGTEAAQACLQTLESLQRLAA